MSNINLTEYSRSAGCGCKIAPKVLEEILQSNQQHFTDEKLIIGNNTKDDAAVYNLDDKNLLIATTDFFMPIVNEAFTFGQVAAANALSDVYAMGGKPILALAILGWPVEKLATEIAQQVLDGARAICNQANITIAGGHSIDTTEPIFGLAVNGICDISNLKANTNAQENDWLFITKTIGVGILATALKRNVITEEHKAILIQQLTALNSIGAKFGELNYVNAMTDITGFGLVGHLIELCEAGDLSAELYFNQVSIIDGAKEYLAQNIVPDATYRNWNGYSDKIQFETGVDMMTAFKLLPDPQTNGGLLVTITEDKKEEFVAFLNENNLADFILPIGKMTAKQDKTIIVKNV